MSALGRVVRAGVGRRRVQTLVMTLTTMTAVTASVLGAGLLVASQAPFDQAFAGQRGAQLTVRVDGAKAGPGQLATTGTLPGVTAAAGPYPVLTLRPHAGANNSQLPVGFQLRPTTLVGRADAGGPVDRLTVTSGTWISGPGQVVLSDNFPALGVGDKLDLPELPGSPELTVVGLARTVGQSADGWVSPAQSRALTAPGATPDYQMLYRFRAAATDAQLGADRAAVVAALPPGSVTGAASYLKIKLAAEKTAATYVPFVVAFGLLGLAMSVLVIGIVVSGAVSSATRRIGILKSLGFAPRQIVRAYLAQALIPAAIGTGVGVVLGNALAIPVLSTAGAALGGGTTTLAPWIDLAVPAAALAAVAATALVPALRAGRLRTAEALAVGRIPRAGRGRSVGQLLGRLPLPRAVSLGLANPFARPGRSATMVAAVVLGTVGVTFGVGLTVSLNAVQDGLNRRSPGSVLVHPGPPVDAAPPGTTHRPDLANLPAIAAQIGQQPGTRSYFSVGRTTVSVAGLAGPTTVLAYDGDSSWGAYQLVSGSWFHGAGQAVVPSGFLKATGTRVGDSVTLTDQGRSSAVRIVGEAFSVRESGMVILTDSSSLTALGSEVEPESVEFDIDLTPGTSRADYLGSLTTALRPYGAVPQPGTGGPTAMVLSMDALALMLTAMLVAVAGLGVLNTVLLDTRERVHELGVFKALGLSPRQTVAMVLTSVSGIGLTAGLLGVPIGIALHDYVLPAMGSAAGTRIPAADIAVYHLPLLAPLVLGGLLIATAGALLPAGWAARARTATALRTE